MTTRRSDSSREPEPKTQAAPAGGPPRPPKKTAKGIDDGEPDGERRTLSEDERQELLKFVREEIKREQS